MAKAFLRELADKQAVRSTAIEEKASEVETAEAVCNALLQKSNDADITADQADEFAEHRYRFCYHFNCDSDWTNALATRDAARQESAAIAASAKASLVIYYAKRRELDRLKAESQSAFENDFLHYSAALRSFMRER